MNQRLLLGLLLILDAVVLYLESNTLSISYHEAKTLYDANDVLHHIITISLTLFGENDFALRLPMMLMHLISVVLLYEISSDYLKQERDRLWLVLIFMLLPGINSAALLVDESGLIIMLLLLYVYSRKYPLSVQYLLLVLYLFVDFAFAFLYLGSFIYGLKTKDRALASTSIVLFSASFFLYGFDSSGVPKGHLLDALALYAAIFSPFVFIYLFYVLYRRFITRRHDDLLWTLASTVLVTSLLLSLRQKIAIQYFAPYLILAMPLAVQTFFNSYRVRLSIYRLKYKVAFTVSLVILIINVLAVMYNKELYRLIDKPTKHFAYDHHVAKDVAHVLHEQGITCVDAGSKKMQLRLRFYGVGECEERRLLKASVKDSDPVTIRYKGIVVYQRYVSKLHIDPHAS